MSKPAGLNKCFLSFFYTACFKFNHSLEKQQADQKMNSKTLKILYNLNARRGRLKCSGRVDSSIWHQNAISIKAEEKWNFPGYGAGECLRTFGRRHIHMDLEAFGKKVARRLPGFWRKHMALTINFTQDRIRNLPSPADKEREDYYATGCTYSSCSGRQPYRRKT